MTFVRSVAKALLRRPYYAASIVAVMAVACALLTSVLAIVDGVLFKPLGYPGERQLVAITLSTTQGRFAPSVSADDLTAWAGAAPDVAFTGFSQEAGVRAAVQPNFFDVIGVRPALGGFAAADFITPRPLIEPRIVTDEVFRSQFGGDPGAIGRVVIVDPSTGSGYRVVGVMPPGFVFPAERWSVGYIKPYVPNPGRPYTLARVIARLPAGAVPGTLDARVLAAARVRNAERGVATSTSNQPIERVEVVALGRSLGAASRPLFTTLLVAAGLLVAIAGLNASSLMGARSIERRRELAVRRALGASRRDVAQLFLIEAGLLVGAGAMVGLLMAAPLLKCVATLLPDDLALFRAAAIDWRVLAFSMLATAALTSVVAIWPLRLVRGGEAQVAQSRGVTDQARSMSWRIVLGAQVGLALVLTIGGSLLVGSLLSLYAEKPPISSDGVLSIPVEFWGMTTTVGREAPERATRVNTLIERLRVVPGVEDVALTAYDLLEHAYQPSSLRPPPTSLKPKATIMHAVTADFYEVVRPKLVAGRWPTTDESTSAAPVLIVSEQLASMYWPNGSALGQTLIDKGRSDQTTMTFTVIGVVKDVRWAAWDEEEMPTIYGPYALLARQSNSAVLIRTSPAGLTRVAEEAVRAMGQADGLLRAGTPAPLDRLFVNSVRPRRFRAWLFGSFAFASLFVVGLGIFGQLAMSTARRTREVGIRMACGATRGRIAALILREQLVPVVLGLAAGTLIAAWAVKYVGSYLYQLTSSDARVWAAAAGLILLTAAAGTLVPALRTSRIDPTEALKGE